jgi:rubrerythrin
MAAKKKVEEKKKPGRKPVEGNLVVTAKVYTIWVCPYCHSIVSHPGMRVGDNHCPLCKKKVVIPRDAIQSL